MTVLRPILLVLAAGLLIQPANPATNFDVQKLADNVYAVVRKDPPGLMVDANNVFVIKDEYVAVVDANGAPAITREVLAALRRLTNKPVRYVVNTHYHDDHIRGNQVYRDAFPGVEFVAHPFARDYLPAQGAANRMAFLKDAPVFASQIRQLLKDGTNLTAGEMTEEERISLSNDVALADVVLRDGASAETVLPTITVDDHLTLPGNGPAVEIRHLGKGHTAADLVVFLPAERIAVTGDLVVADSVGGRTAVAHWCMERHAERHQISQARNHCSWSRPGSSQRRVPDYVGDDVRLYSAADISGCRAR